MAATEEIAAIYVKPAFDDRFEMRVPLDTTVAAFKELIQEKANIEPAAQRLVFSGRILRDEDVLSSYGVKSGSQINVVRMAKNKAAEEASSSSGASASPGASAGGLPQMPGGPDALAQAMNNPMMQALLDNPDFMRSILQMNPQFQRMAQENPEINHILNDPAHLRQMMQAMRNPSAMREMQRNQDRALANIEMLPGGMDALQRMYNTVQSPMEEALGPQRNLQAEEAANQRLAQQLNVARAPTDQINQQAPAPAAAAPAAAPARPPVGHMAPPDLSAILNSLGGGGQRPAAPPQFSPTMFSPWMATGAPAPSPVTPVQPRIGDISANAGVTRDLSSLAERYASQLDMMVDMGFERDQALKALSLTGGNVDAAVNWLVRDA
ncbi:hypothetical protein RI367_004409 [Sorochytrium milnesiophthora]